MFIEKSLLKLAQRIFNLRNVSSVNVSLSKDLNSSLVVEIENPNLDVRRFKLEFIEDVNRGSILLYQIEVVDLNFNEKIIYDLDFNEDLEKIPKVEIKITEDKKFKDVYKEFKKVIDVFRLGSRNKIEKFLEDLKVDKGIINHY